MDFGQWLKHKRQALDLTQDTFAEEVNCAVDTIRKIESGRRRPSRQLAELLADYLKVPSEEHALFVQWARGIGIPEQAHDEAGEPEENEKSPWSRMSSSGQAATALSAPPVAPPGLSEVVLLPPSISPLPFAPTPLVGRERELSQASALLWHSTTRLVTLVGPPGIGKTRLALAVGAALRDDFKDGLTYVPLAGVADPRLVASTLAQALGVKESESAGTPLEAIKDALRNKQTLLVLDNFEQVVEAAPILSEIMSAAPQVKLLVTSRSPLHLRGEKLMNVPPLVLPSASDAASLEELARTEAVALFVERVQDALGSFTLNADNAALVAAICVELDGLPLAIELAAAKTRLLSLPALHTRLQKRAGMLSLLTGGARDAPAHQQTLRHSVESSYTLLGDDEQRLFRRLGIFAGPFDFEMVEEVAGATLDGLEAVLDQSLVRRQSPAARVGTEVPEGTWFDMLASIREYALEQLEAAGELESLSLAHARYFLDLSEKARPHMVGPDHAIWMGRIVAVQSDLRAAMAWGLGRADAGRQTTGDTGHQHPTPDYELLKERRGIALQIAAKLFRFWQRRAGFSEGRRWLEEALAQGRDQPADQRATALFALGSLLWEQTDLTLAKKYLEECIELCKEAGLLAQLSSAYNNLGNVLFLEGKYDEARFVYLDALELSRQRDSKYMIATNLANLGGIALMQGDYEQAERLELEALAIRREINNAWDIVVSLGNLSDTVLLAGNFVRARDYAVEGLALARELGAEHGTGRALIALAGAIAELGEQDRALDLVGEGVEIFWNLGDKHSCIESLEVLAEMLARTGQSASASRIFGALDTLREAISIPIDPSRQVKHNEGLEKARDTLSATDFQASWTVGQAMSLEETVRYALDIGRRTTDDGRP